MIPRYQRILYWVLVSGILFLGLMLIRGCVRNHERIEAMRDQSPIAAPSDIPSEQVSIALANDADGSVTLDTLTLPLPEEPSLRARILVERMLADDARPSAPHPLPAGPAIADFFLVGLPITAPNAPGMSTSTTSVGLAKSSRHTNPVTSYTPQPFFPAGAQLAVVNLTKTFADAHPSGLESEDLTLRSIIATLHANLPQVEQVRFLVDGQPRDTLAGHADLTRAYTVADPAHTIHVVAADGNPL